MVCHPFIVGELALGSLRNRAEILTHRGAQGPRCMRVEIVLRRSPDRSLTSGDPGRL
jgi:hypothetical protein